MHRALLLLAVALLVVAGCGGGSPHPYVSLADLDPTLAAGAQGISPHPVLRIGLPTSLSPQETLLQYGPLIDHLGRTLGRHIEIVLPRSYTETLDLIRSGGVHFGAVSSYAYVLGRAEFGMEALAVPVHGGRPMQQSFILVREYSGIAKFADLKGHSFAYTDPLSASGRLYPEVLIRQLQEPVDRFFEHTIFTSSDDRSIRALDQGVVDGAAVDSVVYNQLILKDPDLQRRLRVIETSEHYGGMSFVVHPRLGANLKQDLQDALLELDRSPEGRQVLAVLFVDRFVKPEEAWYESVRGLAAQVGVRP